MAPGAGQGALQWKEVGAHPTPSQPYVQESQVLKSLFIMLQVNSNLLPLYEVVYVCVFL